MYGVKRTTVYIPDDLKRRVEAVAAQEGCSEAALIRTAIDHYTMEHAPLRPTLPLFSTLDGAPPDLAERDEQYLERFGEE